VVVEAVRTVSTEALRDFWHPVAFADEVTSQPRRVTLLDERLVVYRIADGTAVALRDLCVHRGTPLSLGWVEGDLITCAYHGWTYRPDGACVRIPSVDDSRAIPAKARVDAFAATERYGLVWVCLGEPKADIAAFPEYDDPAYRVYYRSADDWAASGPRLIENFVDTAHFAWVHPGVLGDRSQPRVPEITVRRTDRTIEVELEMPSAGGLQTGAAATLIWDEVTLPMTVRQVRTDRAGLRNVIFLAISPLSGTRLRRFIRSLRDFDLDLPDEPFRAQSELVQSQDRAIVEEQRPEELPVDLAEEMHVRGPDDPAVVYRRALADLGIDG
jgi:vanillate O-demethylase monooxygenase subunit